MRFFFSLSSFFENDIDVCLDFSFSHRQDTRKDESVLGCGTPLHPQAGALRPKAPQEPGALQSEEVASEQVLENMWHFPGKRRGSRHASRGPEVYTSLMTPSTHKVLA